MFHPPRGAFALVANDDHGGLYRSTVSDSTQHFKHLEKIASRCHLYIFSLIIPEFPSIFKDGGVTFAVQFTLFADAAQ